MNPAAIAFLSCLLVLCAQGHPGNRYNKCKCSGNYIGRIDPQLITPDLRIHHPDIFCPNTEIIITTTANEKKCVDPQSGLGKLILRNSRKQRTERAVSTSTSSPTTAGSSTRLDTTSQL